MCWFMVYYVFDTVPVYVCVPVNECIHLLLCLSVCLHVHMCTVHVWLIVHRPVRLCACICACLPLSPSLCMCVFPWAFRVSLHGLVLLIKLCVWGHGCRVGLLRRDAGTNGGQSLLPQGRKETDRAAWIKKTKGNKKKKKRRILFAFPFLSFFTPLHLFLP